MQDYSLPKRDRVYAEKMQKKLEHQPENYPYEKYEKMALWKLRMMF